MRQLVHNKDGPIFQFEQDCPYKAEQLDQLVVPARTERIKRTLKVLKGMYPEHDELTDYICMWMHHEKAHRMRNWNESF